MLIFDEDKVDLPEQNGKLQNYNVLPEYKAPMLKSMGQGLTYARYWKGRKIMDAAAT